MSIIAWIVLGTFAGYLASKLVSGSGGGLVFDLILGVVGAFVGGMAFRYFGQYGVTGFNLWSLLVAVIGAVVALAAYRLLFGGGVRAR